MSRREAVRSRAMTDADVPAVVRLLDDTLGPAPGGVDRRALFEWKHHRNPFGPSIALVAELDDEVVGFRSFMRWRLAGPPPARALMAVRAVDTATAPSVQRLGIFSRLTAEALSACEGEGISLVFNTPNDRSRPGYLKLGWSVVTTWPVWIKARRPARLAAAGLRRDLRSGRGLEPPPRSALVAAADAFAAERAPRSFESGALHTPRSLRYLRWRYVDGPLAYHVLSTGSATVVTRLRERGRLREAVVCEVFGDEDAQDDLRRILRILPEEAGVDHAVAHLGRGWPGRAELRSAGYLRLPRGGITFAVRPLTSDGPDPLEPASWSLCLGDLEVF